MDLTAKKQDQDDFSQRLIPLFCSHQTSPKFFHREHQLVQFHLLSLPHDLKLEIKMILLELAKGNNFANLGLEDKEDIL